MSKRPFKSKVQRYIAYQLLHYTLANVWGDYHELWRIKQHKDGLTEAEFIYLDKRLDELKEWLEKMRKLNDHLKKGL